MMDSIDILKKILGNNTFIKSLSFYEFGGYDLIQNRINLIDPLDQVFSSALSLREHYHLPFWDSFNVSLFNQEIVDFGFLREINFHNKPTNHIECQRDTFLNTDIEFKRYTGVTSLLNGVNTIYHIPLLDFHIPVSTTNQKLCLNILIHLNLKGYLLNSGKSYHFIGNEIVNFERLQTILFNALLFSPVVDKSWIAHQLIQKYCCLRVSQKYGRLPYLIEEIK